MTRIDCCSLASLIVLAACGGGDSRPDARPLPDAHITDLGCAGEPDPDTIPDIITVGGQVFVPGIPGVSVDEPIEQALVQAIEVGGGELSRTFTDASGMFSLATGTSGEPQETYLRVTKTGYLETRLYPPRAVVEDFDRTEVPLFDEEDRDLLERQAGADQSDANGVLIVGAVDCDLYPLEGVTVSSQPAGDAAVYNDPNGIPSDLSSATSLDGFAFLFNLPPGDVTVSGMLDDLELRAVTIPVTPISDGIIYATGIGP